jgi:hypothetical protein
MFRNGDFFKLISSAPLWLVIFFILADQQSASNESFAFQVDHETEPGMAQESNLQTSPRYDLVSYWKDNLKH